MRRLRWILLGSLFFCGAAIAAPEKLQFPSLDSWNGKEPLTLTGYWYRPAGTTPIPAVVMLHGCSGAVTKKGKVSERFENMAKVLVDAGYAVLLVDSFSPRGQREICTTARSERSIKEEHRRLDAYGALAYLAARPDVVPEKIGAIGFSHGATAALQIVDKSYSPYASTTKRFAASIAMYPGCSDTLKHKPPYQPYAPLLVLAGGADDWTPAPPCEQLVAQSRERGAPAEIIVYPGAYHAFDSTSPVKVRKDVWGGKKPVHVGNNPQARADAYRRVPAFFGKHLSTAAAR